MSEVKVNKITPTTNCGTVTLGDSGDTIAIPAGVNLTSGGALTNSGTITNTGTITGVAITGTIDNQVNWQTTVKTTGFTAVAGEGYFCNTTSAAFTVTLPASPSAGDLVGIKDYANTADTNNITIGRNGSNIEGVANDFVINIEGGSITLIYVDATKGWLSTAAAKASDITESPLFTVATGGTITTSGDYKIHTFTGPGTFCVSQIGNSPTVPAGGPTTVSYNVVAGGGGGVAQGAAGGAGGFREGRDITPSYTASPLVAPSGLSVTATSFPITVGGGGGPGVNGSNSIFSSITSTGGGASGGGGFSAHNGNTGGSGGGGSAPSSGTGGTGGAGNTPPVSPPQGNNGGNGGSSLLSGGGGGAGAVGGNGTPTVGGPGGNGVATSITGSSVTRAGGGGGGFWNGVNGPGGAGGSGGGGSAVSPYTNGVANTGGGGAGSPGGNLGGSGIVIIRYKFQ
ncbi:hypothetical protein N9W29_01320 [Candidatus Pelagibacter bacterium]|nr:hypothetical protein [Candidatus Pelagibacter bacterium]